MYKGSKGRRIDKYMLSKYLYYLDSNLHKDAKVCLIGGSALTMLGVRAEGSFDIDFIAVENESDVSNAVDDVERLLHQGKVFIPITKNGEEIERYTLDKHTEVQIFSDLLSVMKLPKDYTKKMHRLRKIPWVIPEGGKKTTMKTSNLYSHLKLYTLSLYDLFCTKVFMPREKDIKDLMFMLSEMPLTMRFFKLKSKKLLERFNEYKKLNKHNEKFVKSGIEHYNFLKEKFPGILE